MRTFKDRNGNVKLYEYGTSLNKKRKKKTKFVDTDEDGTPMWASCDPKKRKAFDDLMDSIVVVDIKQNEMV